MHLLTTAAQARAALHPLRNRLLVELAEPESATGLARKLQLPRQQLNYHLRQLERLGLIEPAGERKQRQWTQQLFRRVANAYAISPAVLGSLAVGSDKLPEDKHTSASLVTLTAQTLEDAARLRNRIQDTGERHTTLALQLELKVGSQDVVYELVREIELELGRIVAKYYEPKPGGRRYRVAVTAYPMLS